MGQTDRSIFSSIWIPPDSMTGYVSELREVFKLFLLFLYHTIIFYLESGYLSLSLFMHFVLKYTFPSFFHTGTYLQKTSCKICSSRNVVSAYPASQSGSRRKKVLNWSLRSREGKGERLFCLEAEISCFTSSFFFSRFLFVFSLRK